MPTPEAVLDQARTALREDEVEALVAKRPQLAWFRPFFDAP
ncbi:MAG: hypothetical protein AAF851_11800 [Myxococcota bacterium]